MNSYRLASLLLMGLGMLQIAASLLVGFLPQFGEYWQMARGIDPIGRQAPTPAQPRGLRSAPSTS